MAKQEKKNRIKIQDLPSEMKISEDELKHVTGGGFTLLHQTGLTSPTLSLSGLTGIWGTNGTSIWGTGGTTVWGSGSTDSGRSEIGTGGQTG